MNPQRPYGRVQAAIIADLTLYPNLSVLELARRRYELTGIEPSNYQRFAVWRALKALADAGEVEPSEHISPQGHRCWRLVKNGTRMLPAVR